MDINSVTLSPQTSVKVCNSAHPLTKFLVGPSKSGLAKKVPGTRLYYVSVNYNGVPAVYTYREIDRTISRFEGDLSSFKKVVREGLLPSKMSEVIDIPETDKYIGNSILEDLVLISREDN